MLAAKSVSVFEWILATAVAVGVLGFGYTAPAVADVYRSCEANFVIRPSDGAGDIAGSSLFKGRGYGPLGNPNTAREFARMRIESCVRAHWAAPHADTAPPECSPGATRRAGMIDYPFDNFMKNISRLICTANPGRSSLRVDIDVSVGGDTGCIPPPNRWAIEVARGVAVNCRPRATIAPRLQPDSGDRTVVPPLGLDTTDAPPLPNIRLPGNDIHRQWIGASGWQACARLCERNSSCRAWTWRAPGTSGAGSQAACLLKSRAGAQVPDACCHSGLN